MSFVAAQAFQDSLALHQGHGVQEVNPSFIYPQIDSLPTS